MSIENTVIGVVGMIAYPFVKATEGAHKLAQKINDLPAPVQVLGFGITRVEKHNYSQIGISDIIK